MKHKLYNIRGTRYANLGQLDPAISYYKKALSIKPDYAEAHYNLGLSLHRLGQPKRYESQVEYASNPVAKNLRDVAQVHLAGLGTRILYTEYGGFDTHAAQATAHPKLWTNVSTAVADFWDRAPKTTCTK